MSYLTGPVNNLEDYQIEFNGFLMGPGTNYELPQGTAELLNMAPVKNMDVQRIWADGSFSGPDFADVFLPQLQVEIYGSDLPTFQAAVAAFRSAFSPSTVGLPLWVKIPGAPVMGLPAKVNKRDIPLTWGWNGGLITASLQFRVTDPVWQSVPRTVTVASSGASSSGLVFPMFSFATGTYTVPHGVADFGSTASSSASATLTNAGNTPAWIVVTVPGPSAGFTLILDGNQVVYTTSLQSTDTVTVDYSTGQVTLNGTVDRTTSLGLRQFTAVPAAGSSSFFFSAASGTSLVTVADMNR